MGRIETKIPSAPFTFERFKPLTFTGDCIITCDWHIPLHDEHMVESLLRTARDSKIRKLAIAGDYWHMDSMGSFRPYQEEAKLEVEREQGQEIAKILGRYFDEILFTSGNHDFRFIKKAEHAFSFEYGMMWMLADLPKQVIKKFTISELDYMNYTWKQRALRLCHPRNFSKIPLKIARELAGKYRCSVLTAHSHHCAQGVAYDGYNLIFDGGGLFDKNKTEYIQTTSTHHEWVPGFLKWKNNVPTLLSPVFGNI